MKTRTIAMSSWLAQSAARALERRAPCRLVAAIDTSAADQTQIITSKTAAPWKKQARATLPRKYVTRWVYFIAGNIFQASGAFGRHVTRKVLGAHLFVLSHL
jgi:hypothetical protein